MNLWGHKGRYWWWPEKVLGSESLTELKAAQCGCCDPKERVEVTFFSVKVHRFSEMMLDLVWILLFTSCCYNCLNLLMALFWTAIVGPRRVRHSSDPWCCKKPAVYSPQARHSDWKSQWLSKLMKRIIIVLNACLADNETNSMLTLCLKKNWEYCGNDKVFILLISLFSPKTTTNAVPAQHFKPNDLIVLGASGPK